MRGGVRAPWRAGNFQGHEGGAVSIFARIAEARIQDAIERGDFDALTGRGRPLQLEDTSHIPPHLRLGYKVLRNAGVAPPEVELRREVYRLDREIAATSDPEARAELRRRRRDSDLSLAIMMEQRAGAAGPRAVRTLRGRRAA
jgi:DnaJ-like protein